MTEALTILYYSLSIAAVVLTIVITYAIFHVATITKDLRRVTRKTGKIEGTG